MNQRTRRQVPWDYLSGVIVTSIYTTTSVVMPQYTFSSLTPHLPVTALILSVVVGLLMTLSYYYGAAYRAGTIAMMLGFLWTALTCGPFILAWSVLSWSGYPFWLAVLAGFLLPMFLLVTSIRQDPTLDFGLKLLTQFPQLHQILYRSLFLLSSFFFGIGIPLLTVFIYTQLMGLSFGAIAFSIWYLILIFGAMLSGGLYGLIQRRVR
jgi:type III secretory pathway component EscS